MTSRYGPKLAGANQQTTSMVMERLQNSSGGSSGMKIGADFPMLCESCFGDSGFTRMMKMPNVSACKITGRPFNVFRWRPHKRGGYKETIVCYEIAAEKNICQCCLNDLDYNIPIALREAFEATAREHAVSGAVDSVGGPTTEVNQMFHYNQQLALREKLENTTQVAPAYKLLQMANQFSSDTPLGDKGRELKLPALCISWIKGKCQRDGCNFRPCCGAVAFPELIPTMPGKDAELRALVNQIGCTHTPPLEAKVKEVLLQSAREVIRINKEKSLKPPDDQTIKTLFITGLPVYSAALSKEVRSAMGAHGEIAKLNYTKGKSHAFVVYRTRAGAEAAVKNSQGVLEVKGKKAKIGWAAKKGKQNAGTSASSGKAGPVSKKRKVVAEDDDEEAEDIEDEKQNDHEVGGVKKAKPLPEYLPGIPLPAGFKLGEALGKAPPGLFECFSSPGKKFTVKKMPKLATADSSNVDATMSSYYPSLQPAALEGQLTVL